MSLELRGPAAPMLAPAHGIGGAKDLPIPLGLAIAAGVAALVISFVVLALAWRTPRHQELSPGRPAPAWLGDLVDRPAFSWTLRGLGLLFFGYLTWALVAGPDLVTNPVLGSFYVLVWVGIVPLSLLFGRVARALSPVRTINALLARLTGGDASAGLYAYPARLGYWPGAVGLFAFVWQELVNPQSAYLASVRLWLAVYVAIMLVGAALFGEEWLKRADPFEVYSDLVARLSVWGRGGPDGEGPLVLRNPLGHIAAATPQPGLVTVVAVLFGSTAFDTFKDQLQWINFADRLEAELGISTTLVNTVGLLGFCLVVAGTFVGASMLTGVEDVRRRALPGLFAHALVPIIVGYITAHYLSYFVEQGQTTLIQLSDPMVRGDNYLLTANRSVDYWLSFHPTLLAVLKVMAIVTGHLVGVVVSHDRAVALLPARHRVSGQVGMLAIMVVYTVTGLYLLMGGF